MYFFYAFAGRALKYTKAGFVLTDSTISMKREDLDAVTGRAVAHAVSRYDLGTLDPWCIASFAEMPAGTGPCPPRDGHSRAAEELRSADGAPTR